MKTGSRKRTYKRGYYSDRRDYFVYGFYTFRECPHLKTAKKEKKLSIRINCSLGILQQIIVYVIVDMLL